MALEKSKPVIHAPPCSGSILNTGGEETLDSVVCGRSTTHIGRHGEDVFAVGEGAITTMSTYLALDTTSPTSRLQHQGNPRISESWFLRASKAFNCLHQGEHLAWKQLVRMEAAVSRQGRDPKLGYRHESSFAPRSGCLVALGHDDKGAHQSPSACRRVPCRQVILPIPSARLDLPGVYLCRCVACRHGYSAVTAPWWRCQDGATYCNEGTRCNRGTRCVGHEKPPVRLPGLLCSKGQQHPCLGNPCSKRNEKRFAPEGHRSLEELSAQRQLRGISDAVGPK